MDKPLLRWGILGTANIARKNWKAIWNSKNGCVNGVASRDLQRSRRFIKECQAQAPFRPAPRAFGSYEDLLAAPDVDAVYIPYPPESADTGSSEPPRQANTSSAKNPAPPV